MKKITQTILHTATLLLLAMLPMVGVAQSFEPVRMSDSVNSDTYEVNPVLSADGKTMFFSRINHAENHYGATNSQDIWFSTKQANGTWGIARRLPNSVNIARYNALFGNIYDNNTYLIAGAFDKNGKIWLRRGFSTITRLGDSAWSKPKRLLVKWYSSMNEGDLADASVTPDGKYIFMSFSSRWASKKNKLYVSVMKDSGEYSRPMRLRGALKEFYSASAPYFNASENCLYFSGVKAKDSVGKNKIYYVSPEDLASKPDRWKDLQVLSDTVNSDKWNSYFRPNPKGTFALFCSNDVPAGKSDIFKVMLIEERPWVKVTGKIVNARNGDLIAMEKHPKILVNGQECDSVEMQKDAPIFTAKLPLNAKYFFTGVVPHYTTDTAVVDVEGKKLYTEKEITITMTTEPFVLVTGRMLNNLSLTPLPPQSKPYISIDGKKSTEALLDLKKGTYTVKLPFGKVYKMAVKAMEHHSMPLDLDLTKYNEYAEVPFDVFAKPLNANMVTLKGRIINTETGQPLRPGIVAKMRVNRVLTEAFKYNDKDASYKMMLPAGVDYELVPSVKNFYNKMEVVDLRNARPRTTVPRDFFVTPLKVGQSVDIENIFFETGKSKLKPESYRSLNALVDFFKEYPDVKVLVGGHTDNRGGASYNRRLSQKRAQAVADYLIGQGISRDRFSTKGYGPDKPKASNKTDEGRAKNRRVDFTIESL